MDIFPVVLGVVIGLVLGILPIIKGMAEQNWRKQFKRQLSLGIKNNRINYEDMTHLADRWAQDRRSVLIVLRILLSEALSDEKTDVSIDSIRNLIQEHQRQEPYSELPENISIQLSVLGKKTEETQLISQLATSLSDLYKSNQNRHSRQVKFTFYGVLVGALGLVIGVAGLFFAVNGSQVS